VTATDFVGFVFSVGGLVCAVVAASLWSVARPKSPAPQRFVLIIGLLYGLIAIQPIGQGMSQLLTSGYRPFVPLDIGLGPTAVVVLGSGTFTAHDWHDRYQFSVLDSAGANRVAEAVRVYNLIDPAWVISSGGRFARDPNAPSGDTMRDAMVQLGVPASRILVETESRNTREEAIVIARMLRRLEPAHVVLVTTDSHMRRSLGTFRVAGIEAVPAIARPPRKAIPWGFQLLPSQPGMEQAEAVMHEIVGIGYYALRGWYRF
jgi:uncharacterized SAM-binding protein YcdF (DUF218 family)